MKILGIDPGTGIVGFGVLNPKAVILIWLTAEL